MADSNNNAHHILSVRIVRILQIFLSGEARSLKELASEFSVSTRTIQRDLNERLSFLPLYKNKQGKFYLKEESLGKLGFKDIREFARLSGIWGLYPSLDDGFIGELLSIKMPDFTDIAPEIDSKQDNTSHTPHATIMIKNQGFEDVSLRKDLFKTLSQAILKSLIITCSYKGKSRTLEPYRLLNNNGIWYLLATEDGKLKHFSFQHINVLNLTKDTFKPSKDVENLISQNHAPWINENMKDALIHVSNNAKEYFMRKHFVANMRLDGEDKDGFYVRCKYSYEDEILNLVKLFLPFIRIIEPVGLKERLDSILSGYLDRG